MKDGIVNIDVAITDLDLNMRKPSVKPNEVRSIQVWRQTFGMAESVDIQLMKQLLAMDPANRLSCMQEFNLWSLIWMW